MPPIPEVAPKRGGEVTAPAEEAGSILIMIAEPPIAGLRLRSARVGFTPSEAGT